MNAIFTLSEIPWQGQVVVEDHHFLVDEPEKVGGKNEFPNPQNYLLGSLASCTAITVSMYAKRKQWELGQIKVFVELKERVKADGTRMYSIHKDLHFGNKELSNEQVDKLIEIADKCPISRILQSQVSMEDKVVASLDKGIEKTYENPDIEVKWQPNKCIHSKKCWRGLLPVFNPQNKPWVNMDGATTERIIKQVEACPSGALSYKMK